MDQERKLRLQAAMATWKAKGNPKLADAVALALEADQALLKDQKAG